MSEEIESNAVVEQTPPKMMVISPFNSNIANKLKLLASSIADRKDGDVRKIWIESYIENVDGEDVRNVRITDEHGTWCTFNPYDKLEGDVLDQTVCVNLYDFYNTVENCMDELITLWIDEEDNELVINSFYSADIEMDELEVRLKIHNEDIQDQANDSELVTSFSLDAITTTHIMNELNVENETDGVNIVIRDGQIMFQSIYHGYYSQLRMKSHDEEKFEKDLSIHVPFNIFQMMISTGHIHALDFKYYENGQLHLSTDEYNFCYQVERTNEDYVHTIPEDAEDFFVANAELVESNIAMMNRLNKQGDVPTVLIEKVSDAQADLTCEIKDRMSISMRTDFAMLSDKSFTIDADILQLMVSKTKVDAFRVKILSNDTIAMSYENQLIYKDVMYSHSIFMEYRYSQFEKWKLNNG